MINKNAGIFNYERGFHVDFDLKTGLSKTAISTKRYLSNMKGMYADNQTFEKQLAKNDNLIYEFYEMGAPEDSRDLAMGTSIIYPGKIGNEYYMTKGHFHTILDTSEVYYCFQGEGFMLLENPEGDWKTEPLIPSVCVYVPKRYAHRTVNIGNTPLITFYTFRGDAGHDYGTIETKGYRKLIIEKSGKPAIIDNPKWKVKAE